MNNGNIVRNTAELQQFSDGIAQNMNVIVAGFQRFVTVINQLTAQGFITGEFAQQLLVSVDKINGRIAENMRISEIIKKDIANIIAETNRIEKQSVTDLDTLLAIDPTQYNG